MLKMNIVTENINTVDEAFEYVKELVNREKEIKWSDKHAVANIWFAYARQLEDDKIRDEFKELIRKEDRIEELICNNEYAICSSKWNDKSVYYYVIGKDKKRNGGTVHESKEEAIVAYFAEKNDNKGMTEAIFKLIGFMK